MSKQKKGQKRNIRWQLAIYDLLIFAASYFLLLVFYQSGQPLSYRTAAIQAALSFFCIFSCRFLGDIYRQIWRYGGIQCYIRLLIADGVAFLINLALELMLPIVHIAFARLLAAACVNLLGALAIRMIYRYAYKCGSGETFCGRILVRLLWIFAGIRPSGGKSDQQKIKVAIIGAGRVGVTFAEELLNNPLSPYVPRCFVDAKAEKAGRMIYGIPVLPEDEHTLEALQAYEVQEVVFAVPNLAEEERERLYHYYLKSGLKIKVYDYPVARLSDGKRHLREFDIEDLLFRKPVVMSDERTDNYYHGKVILVTGGGGSIGSEICRQLAAMGPERLILLDINENGVYDVQQELCMNYGKELQTDVEIVSVTNRAGLERVFAERRPQVVIHAAAHKHVPLMEHNCIEAVENNVFGTINLVELCEAYAAERFLMVSTDKAVNPTSVMGATKRLCEMIVQSAAAAGKVCYSATRFGNVLGSAGSVVPLFKKQIANGGPVTVTDKRIVRYFMTIAEASQLVLQSGAMASNGELFVLDMGKPVKIYDLAQSMIRFSGAGDIPIVETGLRPGEKLYEELLVRTEELDRTDNELIFVERDQPLSEAEIAYKLQRLERACASGRDEIVKEALKEVVKFYRSPEEVNAEKTKVVGLAE